MQKQTTRQSEKSSSVEKPQVPQTHNLSVWFRWQYLLQWLIYDIGSCQTTVYLDGLGLWFHLLRNLRNKHRLKTQEWNTSTISFDLKLLLCHIHRNSKIFTTQPTKIKNYVITIIKLSFKEYHTLFFHPLILPVNLCLKCRTLFAKKYN